jgi:hypothetical protein
VAPPKTRPRHGTLARYKIHVRDKDSPCKECKAANADASKRYYANVETREKLKLYNRAVSRAFIQLKRKYPMDWVIFLNNEMLKVNKEEEAKKNGKGTDS